MNRQALSVFFVLLMSCPAFSAERGAKDKDDDPVGRELSERTGPYVQMDHCRFVPRATACRWDEKSRAWTTRYRRLTLEEKVHYCIYQLRNESWLETDNLVDWEPYSDDPEATPTRELVKLGRFAIPQLLDALNCRARTEMGYSRFTDDKYLVQDAAMMAIEKIACRYFADKDPFSIQPLHERQVNRGKVIAWWSKNKNKDEIEWAKEVLFSKTSVQGQSERVAIDSLYLRRGKGSYPLLVEAFQQLSRPDSKDGAFFLRWQIMGWLLKAPSSAERPAFVSALLGPLPGLKIAGAEGLLKIGDSSGLEAVIACTEERSLDVTGVVATDFNNDYFSNEYNYLMSFLVGCNTTRSREAVYHCLRGRNPYLRVAAIRATPALHMEKAVRALPDLLDDGFVLKAGYDSDDPNLRRRNPYMGDTKIPSWRICDEAAAAFVRAVPDAPQYEGATSERQQRSIEAIKRWWQENHQNLVWNEKRGLLERTAHP